jgi:hypothetical protein
MNRSTKRYVDSFTGARGSCFDDRLMSFSVERKGAKCLGRLAFWVCAAAVLRPAAAHAEPSIASLLRGPPQASDPTAELSQLLDALAQRPFANGENVQDALLEVRRELDQLRALYAQGAPAARLKRHEQIVWAGLSWVDRLEARAALATHAASVRAQAARAEAAAGSKPGP